MSDSKRVVSGIRPTGDLHLGNYFGAIKNFIELQGKYDCYFFVADLHALTTHPNPENLARNIRHTLIVYLASGVDPDKATLYVQSDIPEIPELYVYLNMIAYKGELERCPTFKEKVRQHPDNVNAGLLTYPVLMAADILIHRAHYVPVGKDQIPHLELTRTYARRFNNLYNVSIFPEPEPYHFMGEPIKVPALDGTPKMSKTGASDKGVIFLTDPPEVVRRKIMRAVTDSGPQQPNMPISEPIQNLLTLLRLVGGEEEADYFVEQYKKATIRYVDLKKTLADKTIEFLKPIQERIQEYENNPFLLKQVVEKGIEKARESAQKTMELVRDAIGIRKLY